MHFLFSASILAILLAGCSADKPGSDGPGTDPTDDTGTTQTDDTGTEQPEIDADADGYSAEDDCDDLNPAINPGAEEVCDGIDNNCDDQIDEGLTEVYYPDADGDGYGSDADMVEACEPVEGMLATGGDCDDTDAEVNPLGIELCDGLDNNCDGDTDGEDAADKEFWFVDADGDGHGVTLDFIYTCDMPEGYADNDTDCDDENETIFPSASEVCDGVDNDCDGSVDPSTAVDATMWYRDADSDTYGNPDVTEVACDAPSGFVAIHADCDDTDALIHPEGTEICDGVDQNCDGTIDEGFDIETYYRDYDEDGHGDPTESVIHCTRPDGYVSDDTDCDDEDDLRNPGLPELCDGVDNDCDEIVDEDLVDIDFYPDVDGDGYGDATGEVVTDCIPPAAYVVDSTDCDDADATVNPGEIELCNGTDDDCDGELDEGLALLTFYLDADDDGYGVPGDTVEACDTPDGYSDYDTDCDDDVDSTYPGAYEFCDEVDNDCDEVVDDDCGSSVILGTYESASCDDVAGEFVEEGTYIRVSFNEDGTWMDYSGGGFEIGSGEDYFEACYPGSPWQATAIEWSAGGASYSYLGNRSTGSWDWDTTCSAGLGDGETVAGSIHEWDMGDVIVTKTEIWEIEGHVSRVWFDVENIGDDEITDLDLMMAVDPDQDYHPHGSFSTSNDVNDEGTVATSGGSTSGRTLLFGACDADAQVLGHTSPWSEDDDFIGMDYDGAAADNAMNWGHRDVTIAAGEMASFGFLVTVGEDVDEATEAYEESLDVLCTD
jgi:hypothetical protein